MNAPWQDAFFQYWHNGGWLMLALAATLIVVWIRYFQLRTCLKEALVKDDALLANLPQHINSCTEYPDFVSQLRTTSGAVARVLRHVLARVSFGMSFRQAYQECRHAETAIYTHAFYVMGALIMAAPLIGLLGTVLGMIDTFDAVQQTNAQGAIRLSAGISKALITTQAGLIVALPGTLAMAHLYRLYRNLVHELDRLESRLYLILSQHTEKEAA